jgi:hypothetical protein
MIIRNVFVAYKNYKHNQLHVLDVSIDLATGQYFFSFVDQTLIIESKETTFCTLRIIWKTLVWRVWNHGKCVEISLQWEHLIPWGSSPALVFIEKEKLDKSSP